ncbi:hypothetical protein [Paenibacillus humicola]|uniref:hypothetical protein n=1 Tax=Paenibacillus humicola TaxID=3110540 RepID=UPI00237A6E9F|nr:hypothetical protein [Paenibacillus humicola]
MALTASAQERLKKIAERLDSRSPLQPLAPQRVWDAGLESEIGALEKELGAAGGTKAGIALIAGLYLRNDSLSRSHSYAQEIEDDVTGAYWHGLMHRMEGDYWNSKYWFRRVGSHAAMKNVCERTAGYLRGEANLDALPAGAVRDKLGSLAQARSWDAALFVDLVEQQVQGRAPEAARSVLEEIQRIELSELYAYTLGKASE